MINGSGVISDSYFKINGNKDDIINYSYTKLFDVNYRADIESHRVKLDNSDSVELEYVWNIKESLEVHSRGNLVELFEDDIKKYEIEIITLNSSNVEINSNNELMFSFSGYQIEFELIIRSTDFLNSRLNAPFKLEKQFKTHQNIRYHFIEATNSQYNNQLLIVFSALAKEYTFNYNYLESLKDIPVNKLYILDDFGKEGSYYIGKNKDFSIETSVVSLILNITSKLNIPVTNITTVGSSKGGYSALYYAIKYSFGNVLTMAPSLFLGDFLYNHNPNIMEYIYGEVNKAGIHYLNDLIFRTIQEKRDNLPKITIMVGTSDSRKDAHIMPFVEYLNSKKITYTFDLVKGVDHSQLKFFAPEYIKRYLSSLYGLEPVPRMFFTNIRLNQINQNSLVVETSAVGEDISYAYYWYHNDQLIRKDLYSKESTSSMDIQSNGRYRVRVFLRNDKKQILTKNSNTVIIN